MDLRVSAAIGAYTRTPGGIRTHKASRPERFERSLYANIFQHGGLRRMVTACHLSAGATIVPAAAATAVGCRLGVTVRAYQAEILESVVAPVAVDVIELQRYPPALPLFDAADLTAPPSASRQAVVA